MTMLRVIVADDEPLARRKLRRFLTERTDVEFVGEAADGNETIRLVDLHDPDLLFLDIRMPGASGLDVIARIKSNPHVIFTTAYDKYAVTAFELQALDYLLKPFSEERLERAVARAKQMVSVSRVDEVSARLPADLSASQSLTRLFVRKRGQIIPVRVRDVQLFEAGNEYVTVHVGAERFLVSVRLRDLEPRLDRERFIRIHRSYIVNLDHVQTMTPYDGSRLEIRLANGQSVVASRAQSKALRQLAV